MNNSLKSLTAVGLASIVASACASPKPDIRQTGSARTEGAIYVVKDTTVQSTFEVSATAGPLEQATLSTKLMGSVLEVSAKEGDLVSAGQSLVRIDARDLAARAERVAASMAEAEALQREALAQTNRLRGLYADSAATRAQLDAAEAGLARANAGVATAGAAANELSATSAYAIVRAPFAGIVTKRFVDPGAFAAPGAPLMTVQNGRQLRVSGNATPEAASRLRRGQRIEAAIEGRQVNALIEGVVPAPSGNLYTINAIVENTDGANLAGSAAVLYVPSAPHSALVVPRAALMRQGDLVGVTVRTGEADDVRWIRIGRNVGQLVEVNSGLRAGDRVVVSSNGTAAIAARN